MPAMPANYTRATGRRMGVGPRAAGCHRITGAATEPGRGEDRRSASVRAAPWRFHRRRISAAAVVSTLRIPIAASSRMHYRAQGARAV